MFSEKTILLNVEKNIKNNQVLLFDLSWELGTVTTSGVLSNNNTRIRTNKIYLKKGVTIKINDTQNYYVSMQKYNKSGVATDNYKWSSEEYRMIDEDAYYIIVVRKRDNSILSDVSDVSSKVTIDYKVKLFDKRKVIENPMSSTIKCVAHRGYSAMAPENTLISYTLAKENGFSYVECDLRFTSDGVAVMSHLDTLETNSNGTGLISTSTYQYLQTLDFGSWKSPKYANTRIPTFKEFINHCKKLNLHPYIHIKGGTASQLEEAYVICKRAGMIKNVTWLSDLPSYVQKLLEIDETVRIGWLIQGTFTDEKLNLVKSFKTGKNEVFADVDSSIVNETVSNKCLDADIGLECWTVNEIPEIKRLSDLGVTGITTDFMNVAEVLLDNA